MTFRASLLLLLVPGLALAAPKGHKKGSTKPPDAKPADAAGSGSATDTKPADPPAEPTDAAKAPAPAAAAPASPSPPAPATGDDKEKDKPTKSDEPDVDSLRQEYLSLRDELFKSRARANAVASQLYSTRISIKLTWTSGRYYGVSKASIRLDGATVYEDAGNAIANDDGVRFEGYVAPGRHVVTFHVEAAAKDDDAFTESTESQLAVQAVTNKDLSIAAKAHDSGDIGYAWKKSEHGSYGVGIDVGVKAIAGAAGANK
jgi:hypothetical protein